MFIALCKSVIFQRKVLNSILFCNLHCCAHVKMTHVKTSDTFMFFFIIFCPKEFYVKHIAVRFKRLRIIFFMSRSFPCLSSISQLEWKICKKTCRPLCTTLQYFSSRLGWCSSAHHCSFTHCGNATLLLPSLHHQCDSTSNEKQRLSDYCCQLFSLSDRSSHTTWSKSP